MTLSVERLREVLKYDPDTGDFTWCVQLSTKAPVGQIARNTDTAGHIRIGIDRRYYSGHRLAWLYVHGKWPDGWLDHANGNKADNRLANLRPATRAQNCQNCKLPKSNKSGVKGVFWIANRKRWHATIGADGVHHRLGYFRSLEEATAARLAAARRLHGEFARAS